MDAGVHTADGSDDADSEPDNGDGVVRSGRRKKEQLHFETKSLKSKWEQLDVDRAESEKTDRSSELDELRGKSVKERFRERTGKEEEVPADRASKQVDVDTSCKSCNARSDPQCQFPPIRSTPCRHSCAFCAIVDSTPTLSCR